MRDTCHWKAKGVKKHEGNYSNEDEEDRSKIAKKEAKVCSHIVCYHLILFKLTIWRLNRTTRSH